MYSLGLPSKWEYQTSNTVGVSLSIGAAEGGTIAFTSPAPENGAMTLNYASVGVGYSVGVKMPNFVVSGSALPSWGILYRSDTFNGELERSDLTGPCYFLEVGGGLGASASATIIVLGVSWSRMGFKLVNVAYGPLLGIWGEILDDTGILDDQMDMHVNAVLFATGMNVGAVAGGGVTGFAGMVW